MFKGKQNGFEFEYPNGVYSPYRLEIIEIISYTLNGESRYRIEYDDGTTEDVDGRYFTDGAFITNALKYGKCKTVKSHNATYYIYRGYVYDYQRDQICTMKG